MKVIAGKFKGHRLKGPKQLSIRPAAAKVRKSIFDILGDIQNTQVLDLFAGTGSVGIEALSRGAQSVTFVDNDRHALSLLFDNLKKLNLLDQCYILKKPVSEAIEFLGKKQKSFDLIFLDPPYDKNHIDLSLKKITKNKLLNQDSQVISEHSPREEPTFLSGLCLTDQRKYGQTLVSFLKKQKINL